MGALRNYVIPRIITYLLVIYVGLTLCFLIPRLAGLDPVILAVERLSSYAEFIDPHALEEFMDATRELFGLKGSLLEQYFAFLRRTFTGDLGVSLTAFPTPVIELIWKALPWTIGLLLTTTLIAWLLGNVAGAIAAYYSDKNWSHILTGFAIALYPIPYYILALILFIVFTYFIPLFPSMGGVSIGMEISFSLESILDILHHAFLPALSLVVAGFGWWFISIKNLAFHTKSSDYTSFAEIVGLPKSLILRRYVLRNSLLPQVTGLSISLATIFNGALMTEFVFSYPGIGYLLYQSVINGDVNLMMGIVIYSIIAVASAALAIDLLYPLVDPRIRYR